MKNQLIHDVPRELLWRIYRHLFVEPALNKSDWKDLRALLEAPATCKFDYSSMNAEQRLSFCRGEI